MTHSQPESAGAPPEPTTAAGPAGARPAATPARFLNRELSWLDFNERVLALAEDAGQPLLERVKFLAIVARNLDEFFQVRVGNLHEKLAAGVAVPSADGRTPAEQLAEVRARVRRQVARQAEVFTGEVVPALELAGIGFARWDELDSADRAALTSVFEDRVFPVLTPLAVDPGHPFPYISNLSLNLAVAVAAPAVDVVQVARIKVPPVLPRFLRIPDGERFIALEELIAAHLPRLFPGMEVRAHHAFRLTRDVDVDLEDETDDLLEAVQLALQRRRRSPVAVRLEVAADMPEEVLDLLTREINLDPGDVMRVAGPLDLGGLWDLYRLDRQDLKDEAWPASTPTRLAPTADENPRDVFRALQARDLLVHHPYEAFEATVLEFIEQAASDPDVLAIKLSLYRTSGPDSPIIRALTHAASLGKQVVALIELTARFDEQANITWAQVLEEAGVHVVYGMVGYKTHAKVTLVVRNEGGRIRRYCHLGTGNYHPGTARLYEDVGLLTADPRIGADVTELFNVLTGYSRQRTWRRVMVAPAHLRAPLLEMIAGEACVGGRIAIKVNALVDAEVIDALYAASQAGCTIDLLVRGICCLRPGVPGLSDRIRVRSLVGRFLEHSRLFRFGAGSRAQYWIGSADLMHRNLDRRVEVVVPVEDPEARARLDEVFELSLADDELAWWLDGDGRWARVAASGGGNAQRRLQEAAVRRAQRAT